MRLYSGLFVYLIVALTLFPRASLGHSPHHVITDVATSRADSSGSDVFVLITDQIFRSNEQGSSWKNLTNGLNNEFAYTSLGISPSYETDQTVFVATAGDGVYQSTDRGHSWRLINAGLGRRDIARLSVSGQYPNDKRILAAAATGGVWRRAAGDEKWQMVLTEKVRITAFFELSVPGKADIILAGDSRGGVWRSDDNGRLWALVHEFPDKPAITSIAATAESMFVGTSGQGLFRSNDSGQTFVPLEQLRPVRVEDCRGNVLAEPVPDRTITSVSFSPPAPGQRKIFVTTWYDAVFVSADNGNTWSKWSDGLSCDQQGDDMSEAHFRSVVTSLTGSGEPIYWLGAFDGLFRSPGAGAPWHQLETLPLGLIKGMAVTGAPDSPLTIALATYGGGFYLTADRGLTWTIGNKGLETTRLTGLSFSPDYGTDGVIYGGASRRLLRSNDRGASWQRIDLQPPSFGRRVLNKLNRWGISTSWLRRSGSSATLQVYPTFIVQPPDSHGNRVLFATRFNGVMGYDYEREDIVYLWPGTDEIMNSLEISSFFETDHTLFASIRDQGLIRSEDGGNTWTAVDSGLEFTNRWANSEEGGDFRRDVVVAISPDYASDSTVFAGSPAGDGVYVSENRGASWARLQAGSKLQTAPTLAIALSPEYAADHTLMISIKGQGLFRSKDGGGSFQSVGQQLIQENASIEWLDYSPGFADDRTIVAASDEQLFLSEDGGDSWSQVARPVRYEDMRDVISYTGDWQLDRSEEYSALTESSTTDSEGSARLQFVGGGVRWLGSCGPDHGSAKVYLDGKPVAIVDCHERPAQKMQALFVAEGLGFGAHTIEVRTVSTADHDVDGPISVDAFDVLPATSTAN